MHAPAPDAHAVPAEISRSWLLVSARDRDAFDPAVASRADQVILDLEDGVDQSFKSEARGYVVEWLAGGGRAWARVNQRSGDFWADDLDALRGRTGLAGVVLAKAETPEQVTETFDRLGGVTPVVALVESAAGIENAVAIAQARGVFRLAFGSGDYRRDTGAGATDLAMAYPRSRLVSASAVGRLPGPIDGPTVSTSHPVVRDQSESAVAMGMTGKLCLDRRQLPVINECISPTVSDIVWAREFLQEFNARGRVVRDGSDRPRLHRAEKIDALARDLGIDP
ncbi:aldolase/citrate lyase family protein [Tsukamurella sp. 8F]|uniref:HpcH/HpaI aldolase/citrate lyase family protein n=1 Tax=unclassified Tsukamurella TaxID=2633480 RepID=UPI0023B88ADF|nr:MULTISPECIES: aldolase/citrate lyase family protein [unclassified Tsukamurella]MDF0531489.1 aldolase/citrate lyase family protein [Tsukamurella sp. 8J]MDF0588733.1 aldolase/citrate lyase family protein [Tsukamurella sp. 8F]